MNEERIEAYLSLIQELLECPSGEENEVFNRHLELVDEGFVQVCEQRAQQLQEEGEENQAGFLQNLAQQVGAFLGRRRSAAQLADCAETGTLHINPIIYAEVSIGFKEVTEVESVLSSSVFQRDGLPYEAAFLAGQAFLQYRRRGGVRRSPLPDFYIGAHGFVCR